MLAWSVCLPLKRNRTRADGTRSVPATVKSRKLFFIRDRLPARRNTPQPAFFIRMLRLSAKEPIMRRFVHALSRCLPLALLAALLVGYVSAPPALGNEPAGNAAEMVLVPAGPFIMGSHGKDLDEDAAEKPRHELSLPAFTIDKYEVTAAQYARFLNAVKRTRDDAGYEYIGLDDYLPLEQIGGLWQPKKNMARLPMGNVTWYGATAFAQWAGKRLPTEAEWEKAARGTDGRKYPWGEKMDFHCFRLGIDRLAPVGSFPKGASPYGCLDMGGNVWEWTSSLFQPYPYKATDGREDPQAAGRRVARGGSWGGEPEIAHASYRFRPYPDFRHYYLGFRCAKSVP